MSNEDVELTPEYCLHDDLDELPDGGVCNECMAIIYKHEYPINQEMPTKDYLPKEDDLDEPECKY